MVVRIGLGLVIVNITALQVEILKSVKKCLIQRIDTNKTYPDKLSNQKTQLF
tara:strand:+ start:230 stop:385 length:156 start_codon:yes stop_codon:yes gene_type:complete